MDTIPNILTRPAMNPNANKFSLRLGPMFVVFKFMGAKQILAIQSLNRKTYKSIVPQYRPTWGLKAEFRATNEITLSDYDVE